MIVMFLLHRKDSRQGATPDPSYEFTTAISSLSASSSRPSASTIPCLRYYPFRDTCDFLSFESSFIPCCYPYGYKQDGQYAPLAQYENDAPRALSPQEQHFFSLLVFFSCLFGNRPPVQPSVQCDSIFTKWLLGSNPSPREDQRVIAMISMRTTELKVVVALPTTAPATVAPCARATTITTIMVIVAPMATTTTAALPASSSVPTDSVNKYSLQPARTIPRKNKTTCK